jgi:hypothetical protein
MKNRYGFDSVGRANAILKTKPDRNHLSPWAQSKGITHNS